jgi:hypothetical protein
MHPKLLGKQEHVKPKISRWKEIMKIRIEINERETKKIKKESMKNNLVL